MEMPKEDKKQILNGFLDIFTRISSKEYQKRVWVNGQGPEVDDFDDTVNDFFIECDPILENYKDFGIADNQYGILKKFQNEFRIFSDENNWPEKFIDTPEWENIMHLAREVLKTFNYQKVRK